MINKLYHVFNKKNLLTFAVTVLFLIPVLLPLFHKGFFVTDDGEWMIIRLSAFFASFRDGQIPVRILGRLNFGYGYPAATFLYPGIMYLGSIIHLLKVGFIDSIKIILALSLTGSFVFTYLWLRQYFYKFASLIGALLYLYLPYHIYDVYVRGSIGEVFALLWVPFILWNIERESLFFSTIGIAILFLSHNTLAFLFMPIIIIYMLIKVSNKSKNRSKFLYQYILILVLGVGISAFFLIPVIFELSLTQFSKIKISNPLEYFENITLLGWESLFVLTVGIVVWFSVRKQTRYNKILILFFSVGIISIFFGSKYSHIFWEIIPSDFIQFPFRLLSITMLCVAFICAFIISNLKVYFRNMFIFISVVFLSISTCYYISLVKYTDKGEGFYLTNDATTTIKDEYMPVWVKEKPTKRPDKKIEIINGSGSVKNIFFNNRQVTFNTTLNKNSIIQINTIYWPGWIALVDGRKAEILYNNNKGLMQLRILAGSHQVKLKFVEELLPMIGDIISAVCLVIVVGISKNKRVSKLFKL